MTNLDILTPRYDDRFPQTLDQELLTQLAAEAPSLFNIAVASDYHFNLIRESFTINQQHNPNAERLVVLTFVVEQYATDPDLLVPVSPDLMAAAGLELRKPTPTPTQQLAKRVEDLAIASIAPPAAQPHDDAAESVRRYLDQVRETAAHDIADPQMLDRFMAAVLISPKTVAALTNVTPSQMSLVDDGLPQYRPRGIRGVRYRASDVLEWLSQQAG